MTTHDTLLTIIADLLADKVTKDEVISKIEGLSKKVREERSSLEATITKLEKLEVTLSQLRQDIKEDKCN